MLQIFGGFSLLLIGVSAFDFPGSTAKDFAKGDKVNIFADRFRSHTVVSYWDYSRVDWCPSLVDPERE